MKKLLALIAFIMLLVGCDQDISIKTNNTGADITKLTFQCIDNMSYAVSINGSFAQIKDSIGRYKTCDTLVEVDWSKRPAKVPRKPSIPKAKYPNRSTEGM